MAFSNAAKTVTIFSAEYGEGKWIKNVYDKCTVVRESGADIDESSVTQTDAAVIRIFSDSDVFVNIGDKIFLGEFLGDKPDKMSYTVCEIRDNRMGSGRMRHIKITVRR